MGNYSFFNKTTFIGRIEGNLEDKYEIVSEIGSGAYARALKIQNKITKEMYACKELQKKRLSDLESFNAEIELLGQLDHPNIIKLYEIYENNKYIYLVMELCTGGELFDRILSRLDSGKGFTEKEAADIFKQLMSAVHYCHSRKITHRDLKPENLLLLNEKDDSPVKVIDFGMSKIFNKDDCMYERVGTSYYIAPEVLEGFYDEKCDIWSCGVILYVLLSGFPPFNGETDEEIFEAIKKRDLIFPEDVFGSISEEAKDLIKKMLSPSDTRLTAAEVLKHPWVQLLAPNSSNEGLKFQPTTFKSYYSSNKFKKAVLTYMASRLSEEEIKNLKATFQLIDENGDGMLSLEELKNAVAKADKIDFGNVEEIFKAIDTDNSGVIDYTEFIAASLEKKTYLQESKLKDAFKLFDKDGSGKVSKKEITSILNCEKDSDYIDKLFEKYDLNKDGEIDFDEFTKLMREMA